MSLIEKKKNKIKQFIYYILKRESFTIYLIENNKINFVLTLYFKIKLSNLNT